MLKDIASKLSDAPARPDYVSCQLDLLLTWKVSMLWNFSCPLVKRQLHWAPALARALASEIAIRCGASSLKISDWVEVRRVDSRKSGWMISKACFASKVVLDKRGWVDGLGLASGHDRFFFAGRRQVCFRCAVDIFSNLAWRLLLLNSWPVR